MPRSRRLNQAGLTHHVICRGNRKQVLFRLTSDFEKYLNLLDKARQEHPLVVYNYALMSNHVHLLVKAEQENSLSKTMEQVSGSYAKYFNAKYEFSGHVFQGRFKSFLIEDERYFLACSRYIDLNPVKAGCVNTPQEYPWCAYRTLAYGEADKVVREYHELYLELGSSPAEMQASYRAFIALQPEKELDLEKRKAGILGSKEFRSRFKKSKMKAGTIV